MAKSKLGVLDYDELNNWDETNMNEEDMEELDSHRKGHAKLIKSLQQERPDKKKGRVAVRREAANEVAEFSAVKRKSTGAHMNHLLQSVKETGEGKALDKVNKLVKAPLKQQIKTLETPLEKPVALKTKRTVLYDQAKKDVSRWNAVVYHNRLADQLVYPLNAEKKLPKKTGKEAAADFVPMTPLEEEMAKILYGEEYLKERKASMENPVGPSDGEAYMLSVEEALAVHSEMARLRALQSYEMTKAKRQNKIKSKKYHRLLRKEKIKKQLKDFEELQHTDPGQAMVKLNELEESRVQERMSLKHRNTSKWAKMQAARAKYNKDSRLALTEQLKISRDLTQKVQESSDEEDDLDMDIPQLVKPSMNNPWMLNSDGQGNEKLQMYYSGYKKLWDEINSKKEVERKKEQALLEKQLKAKLTPEIPDSEEPALPATSTGLEKISTKSGKKSKKKRKVSKIDQKETEPTEENESVSKNDEDEGFTEHDLEGLFEKAENKLKSQALRKLKDIEKNEKRQKRLVQGKIKAKERLRNKKTAKQREGDADEIRGMEIDEDEQNFEVLSKTQESFDLVAIRKESTPAASKIPKVVEEVSKPGLINPDNYLKISKEKRSKRSKFDGEGLKDVEFDDNNGEEDSQGMIIADAFEDDDVIAEFKNVKDGEIEGSKPKDIDLHLPGWGEWGGKGIVPNPKRRERFIIKAPPAAPRKDARLSHVILNEEASQKVKEHQVRNLPFPFKRVKDFEKTIRAPIGKTWLPEQSTKDLIAPKVITRLGAVIQPIDEDILVKNAEGKSKTFKVPISIKQLATAKKVK